MSLAQIDLAPIMRKAQQKKSEEDIVYCKNILDQLSESLEKDGLSPYFSEPLSEDEKKFLNPFFSILKNSIETIENMVPSYLQPFLSIELERAKQLTLTFGIHLVDGTTGTLYLSWSKGVFDEE